MPATRALLAALLVALATAAPALAGPGDGERPTPPEEPGPPDGAPEPGVPTGFPGEGDHPADPRERFPSEACPHAPPRDSRVPAWVVLPFDGCGDDEEEEGDESGSDTSASTARVAVLP